MPQFLRFVIQVFERGRPVKKELSTIHAFETPQAAANAVIRFSALASRVLGISAEENAEFIGLPYLESGYGPDTCAMIVGTVLVNDPDSISLDDLRTLVQKAVRDGETATQIVECIAFQFLRRLELLTVVLEEKDCRVYVKLTGNHPQYDFFCER